jgi:glycosyltransferase involved in cell wall biosynthesis
MLSVDILLPAYNPLPGWELAVISRFRSLQKRMPEHLFQLILVNDGSQQVGFTEGVQKLLENLSGVTVLNNEVNWGKGKVLREGVRQSSGDIILYTDIDWPYTEESMIAMIHALEEDAEVVVGVRDEKYYKQLPKMRRRISHWLQKFNSKLLHLQVDDTQAGLKGFRKNIKAIFLSTTINRYLFDLEFIYILSKKKIRITPLPVELRPGIKFSKMNRKVILVEGWNFIRIWMKA